jgi:hypothetical protein
MSAENVRAAFAAAPDFEPESPRPLRREAPPAEPFPIDALGGILGAAANAIHDKIQAPRAMCAQSVLAAATLAVQPLADVELPTGRARPLSGFFVTVGESGERKSTVDGIALWPVRKREETLRATYDAEHVRYSNENDAWNRQRDQILGDKRKYADKAAKAQALEDLGPAPQPPLVPMLTCPDPTYEGLTKLLQQGYPSVGVFTAEGGQFVGGHAMNADNKLKTSAALSSLWDGEPIRRVRQGDGSLILCGRRVSMHLMLQPGVAASLLSDPVLQDQGTLSRLLAAYPESTAGSRMYREAKPESEAAIKRYGARLLGLMEAPLPLVEGKPNELKPRAITLAADAKHLWVAFHDSIEQQISTELSPIRGLANKAAEHAARIAGVLALLEDMHAVEVRQSDLAAAIALVEHYLAEALRLYESGLADPTILRAEGLLAWLQTWDEPLVGLPEIYQRGPGAIRDAKLARALVRVLEDHGHLVAVDGGGPVRGQHRREAWRLVKGGR